MPPSEGYRCSSDRGESPEPRQPTALERSRVRIPPVLPAATAPARTAANSQQRGWQEAPRAAASAPRPPAPAADQDRQQTRSPSPAPRLVESAHRGATGSAHYLGDLGDDASAVGAPLEVDDEIDRRAGPARRSPRGASRRRPSAPASRAGEGVGGRVGVDGRERAVVAGIQRGQQVERLRLLGPRRSRSGRAASAARCGAGRGSSPRPGPRPRPAGSPGARRAAAAGAARPRPRSSPPAHAARRSWRERSAASSCPSRCRR